jgi:hypothetical protein
VAGDDGHEEVTSPDQHRPTISGRLARFGAILTAILLLLMTIGNHQGRVEDIFLYGFAGALVLMVIGDWVLRRLGLRS